MSYYRKLWIGDTEYRYYVGKIFTKVVTPSGTKIFGHAEWGTPLIDTSWWSTNDQENERRITKQNKASQIPYDYKVGPGEVAGMILNVRRWKNHYCNIHNDCLVTGLTPSPFDREIRSKTTLVHNCPRCLQANAMDI